MSDEHSSSSNSLEFSDTPTIQSGRIELFDSLRRQISDETVFKEIDKIFHKNIHDRGFGLSDFVSLNFVDLITLLRPYLNTHGLFVDEGHFPEISKMISRNYSSVILVLLFDFDLNDHTENDVKSENIWKIIDLVSIDKSIRDFIFFPSYLTEMESGCTLLKYKILVPPRANTEPSKDDAKSVILRHLSNPEFSQFSERFSLSDFEII